MSTLAVSESLAWAHPLVQEWFVRKFGTPTEPQEQGWPHILAGRTTLISAPTGSGKTLAAFLTCIDALVRKAVAGELADRTEILYVSPLKALGNDIQKNLEGPLSEILTLAGERGLLMPEIRVAVRTGDTPAKERVQMLKRPPHILVTTPESLYILLTAEKSRNILRDVRTVIVDEIHAVADDKRGAHLALSLERLEHLTAKKTFTAEGAKDAEETQGEPKINWTALGPESSQSSNLMTSDTDSVRHAKQRQLVRIGLSATQKPIEVVAHFLTGNGRPDPVIVQIGHQRTMDLAVEIPGMELGPIASNGMWDEVYDRISALAQQHKSTLIFVNTRRLAERIAFNLAERLGEQNVAAHHGSLARKLRLEAERKLKNNEIKALVATASLELGIDIGHVDLVCLIGSPRSIAVALQRVGRAGHWRGAIPKGRFFPTTRDELVECAALVRAIQQGELDRLIIPECPLDILAQQMVAMCAAEEWQEEELFETVRGAFPYRDLERKEFEELLVMLSEGFASQRGRSGAYLYRDRVNQRLKARRGARMAAIMNGGAIPETALYTVVAEPEGMVVGTLHEDFAVESMKGDVVLLGNTSWRIRKIETAGRILVEDAHGAPPSIPFWLGEAPGRTIELSEQVGELRQTVSDLTPHTVPGFVNQKSPETLNAVEWLKRECGLDDAGSEQIIEYIVTGRAVLGAVPTTKTIIAERFFDEGGGMQLILHAPFGARINKAWGLSLRKRFCVGFNFELQASATDNGVNISLAEQHSFPLADVFHFLHENTVKEVLQQAALLSPLLETRWRWDANRALALLRYWSGKKIPLQVQRTRSADLLASVFPDAAACQENIDGPIQVPDHPLIREVMKDIFQEALDLNGLKQLLRQMASGEIQCVAVDTPVPSVFSHEVLNANPYAFLDDAPLEERRARAVEMRRVLPASVLSEAGALDQAAIDEVRDSAWPDCRDADELADTLHTLIALPERPTTHSLRSGQAPARRHGENQWQGFFERLRQTNRATRARLADSDVWFWVSAEKARVFRILYPEAHFEDALPEVEGSDLSHDDAMRALVTGWLMHLGPVTASNLAGILHLPLAEIDRTLIRIETSGLILRGSFEKHGSDEMQWCERRLLARIHRLTLGSLRKQIEPVTAAVLMRWLLRWQHVAPGSQTRDERGTMEVLRQLQGFEIPASAWERQILARRVSNYDPKLLDQLCLTGAVGWGRLSPHPAMLQDSSDGARRVVPTSVAPITFFIRDDAEWMALPNIRDAHAELEKQAQDSRGLSAGAREVLAFLRARGASFFADIVRSSGNLKAEVETALWELVAAGLVTADGFDNLRSLIDPKRRSGQGSGKASRPRHSAGRWSLLYPLESKDHSGSMESVCRVLLTRYGVVFRELLVRESILPRWRDLLIAFRRLEDRGEIRGGRFVSGFAGEQFALPIAVESLRAMKNIPPSGEVITISAADPLNLVGIVIPGERVPAISGKHVSFMDGKEADGNWQLAVGGGTAAGS
ncbi:MAG TPA: DEAD/DEAH box helicase [Candidatus Saccharimonadales bacterium]|jgi:ATP-dependent Lhr-like helicase|nr:DEAD/DEAH box helicase [Candidatus Saccharimonadales bacterium]